MSVVEWIHGGPKSPLRVVSAQGGVQGWLGVEHHKGALSFHFGGRLLTLGQEDNLKKACLGLPWWRSG